MASSFNSFLIQNSKLCRVFFNHKINKAAILTFRRTLTNVHQEKSIGRWKPLIFSKYSLFGIGLIGSTGGLLLHNYFGNDWRFVPHLSLKLIPHIDAAKVIPPDDDDKNNPYGLSRSQQFNFIADVVEKTSPAVVCIEIQGRHPFFGNTMTLSNGSGFIVRDDGLILTNAHVVANKSKVMVKLQDGRMFTGNVEDIDPVSDLATIKIKCDNLPILKLGNSSKLRPGEWVVAMGSPLSLSNTITTGVISSVSRESKELGLRNTNMEYIQTDASINYGNSGGPLVNLDGEAIGINTMKVTAGISFAVPSDYASDFLKRRDERIKKETSSWFGLGSASSPRALIPKRKYIGITMIALTPTLIMDLQQRQQDFAEDITHGVLVWKVIVGSPAYKGGLYPGDVIVNVNGKEVMSTTDINKALESNTTLNVNVIRRKQNITLTITPEETD